LDVFRRDILARAADREKYSAQTQSFGWSRRGMALRKGDV
jgi:hypothetical protein